VLPFHGLSYLLSCPPIQWCLDFPPPPLGKHQRARRPLNSHEVLLSLPNDFFFLINPLVFSPLSLLPLDTFALYGNSTHQDRSWYSTFPRSSPSYTLPSPSLSLPLLSPPLPFSISYAYSLSLYYPFPFITRSPPHCLSPLHHPLPASSPTLTFRITSPHPLPYTPVSLFYSLPPPVFEGNTRA